MANNFNLFADEDDTEKLLGVGPKELTNEELLELEQKRITKEEEREKETAGQEREEPLRKFTSSLKSLKIWNPTLKYSH